MDYNLNQFDNRYDTECDEVRFECSCGKTIFQDEAMVIYDNHKIEEKCIDCLDYLGVISENQIKFLRKEVKELEECFN